MSEDTELDYWKANGIEKPQQIVVCAALRFGKVMLCGARHCDKVMRQQAEFMSVSMKNMEQGFIDQFGDFLTRKEAMQVVKESGQAFDVKRNGGGDVSLTSEGLY